ncbi:MAG: SpoIIIAH-like family protein [Clostridia bacterium]|nr:SpoIIIAH-like family protein [Clostridia bacterium]
MGFIVKKRQVILATLIIALGFAVFINWYYNKPQVQSSSGVVETTKIVKEANEDTSQIGQAQLVSSKNVSEYFNDARVNRSKAHEDSLEVLNEIIKDSSSSPEAVMSAEKALEEISKTIKLETDLENLIIAKTGGECVVVINDNKVQVIVNKNTLNDTISTQIIDIIATQANIFSENVTLIEAK